MGSMKSRAAFRPAFAPWSPSGAKRMVAPLEPPVLVSLSYLEVVSLDSSLPWKIYIYSRPTAMPSQSHQHRPIASIIIVIFFFQGLGNLVVHLLIVVLGWRKDASSLTSTSLFQICQAPIVEVKVGACATCCC